LANNFLNSKSHQQYYLGVPPQEKCGVGLFAAIFFGVLHLFHAQGKTPKKDFRFYPSRLQTQKLNFKIEQKSLAG
jgi:hypothetical protein